MRIPETTYEALVRAMEQFDYGMRNTREWRDWEDNKAHKYAVKYREQRYPVKRIISLATGVSYRSFGGGAQANSYVRKRDLQVVRLRQENAGG
jgi:5-methylcytosine-specific restriction protein A